MLIAFLVLGIAYRSPKQAVSTRFSKNNKNNGIGCDMCTQIVNYIKKLLDDQTVESEIEALVEQFCTTFSSPYDTLCKVVSQQYLPQVIEWLEQGLNSSEICTKVGLCSTTNRNPKKITKKKNSNINDPFSCEMCTQIINYIKKLLDDHIIESEIAVIVEQFCTTFPSPYDSLCKNLVEQYLPQVLEWLQQGINATNICTKFSFCTQIQNKKIRIQKNELSCEMCTKVVNYVEQLLKDQTIEAEIEMLSKQYCETFQSPYDSLCSAIVEQNLPTVLQLIEEGLETYDVCTKIGLCSKPSRNTNARFNKKKLLNRCEMCTSVVDYINSLLVDQAVESEITALVKQLCTTFSSPYDSLCNSLVEQNVPTILNWLNQNVISLDICVNVGLCPSESCNTCKSWFNWIEDNLQNVTVEGLWKLVSEECPKVPYLKYFCQTLNEQNIQTFVSLILSELPPEKCCEWISVC